VVWLYLLQLTGVQLGECAVHFDAVLTVERVVLVLVGLELPDFPEQMLRK
jgi:hypothetical protein